MRATDTTAEPENAAKRLARVIAADDWAPARILRVRRMEDWVTAALALALSADDWLVLNGSARAHLLSRCGLATDQDRAIALGIAPSNAAAIVHGRMRASAGGPLDAAAVFRAVMAEAGPRYRSALAARTLPPQDDREETKTDALRALERRVRVARCVMAVSYSAALERTPALHARLGQMRNAPMHAEPRAYRVSYRAEVDGPAVLVMANGRLAALRLGRMELARITDRYDPLSALRAVVTERRTANGTG